MTRAEWISLVEDQFGEFNTNQVRTYFHPEIIAYTIDKYYRYFIGQAYNRQPSSIEGCAERSYNVPVYSDLDKNLLFSVVPKAVIPLFDTKGGVLGVWKTGDNSAKLEPYGLGAEKRDWHRTSVSSVSNIVRWWFDRGVALDDISAEGVADSTFTEYQSLVWYDQDDSSLTSSDTVGMDILTTFYDHGDSQEVYVPFGRDSDIIDMTLKSLYAKIGVNTEAFDKEDNNG